MSPRTECASTRPQAPASSSAVPAAPLVQAFVRIGEHLCGISRP
ncbi:hypothetical protein ACIGJO_16220 [Streptomyces sp. NPDC079020]